MTQQALFAAIARNDRLEIERLLREDAKLHETRVNGRTPLHMAVETALPATVLAVLHTHPAVNSRIAGAAEGAADPKINWTALHIAAARGNLQIVEMLLSQPDIDVAVRTPDGRLARDLAAASPRPTLAQLFADQSDRKSRQTQAWER